MSVDLHLVGVSHKTAPVAVREKLVIVPELADEALRRVGALSGLREVAVVSTCNRVEIYAVASDGAAALRLLSDHLAQRAQMAPADMAPHLYSRRAREALHHLFRVTASLDSLVLGEPQILGQVKDAYDLAVRCGTAGAVLGICFPGAFRVARRVRRDTAIARSPVSVSSVAVDLARQVFGGFEGRNVLLVGAGKMSDLAARAFRSHGASLTVTNRTLERAKELAARIGCLHHPFEDLAGAIARADIVLASTGARVPVLTRELVAQAQRARRGRRLFLIDIAVPRDVEPRCTDLEGVYLADIDDLQKVIADNRDGRRGEADRAEAIVEEEVVRFLDGQRGRKVGPTIAALRARFLGTAEGVAEKWSSSTPGLSERQRRAYFEMATEIAKKLLHDPSVALKARGAAAEGPALVQAVETLFGLAEAGATGAQLSAVEPAADEGDDGGRDKKAAEG